MRKKPFSFLWGPLCRLLLAVVAMSLTSTSLKAATIVTTLGGGDPSVSFQGNRDGDTLHSALFHTPAGLALDSSGQYLFVADRDNNAVRYLDLLNNFTFHFATNKISKPVSVAVDVDNFVYVLNRGNGINGTIYTFDLFGELVFTNATKLTNATSMAMDTTGNIYVTVQSNKLIRIDAGTANQTTIATIPNTGTTLQGIIVKHNGLIAACDSGRNGIYLIDPTTGIVTTNAGFHGAGDFITNSTDIASSSQAKFNQPMGIAEAGDGKLMVTEYANNRIKVVLPSGVVSNLCGVTRQFWGGTYPGWYDGAVKIPDSIAPNAQCRLPYGIVFASDGTIYTSEDYYHLIRKVTGSGLALPPPPPPTAPQNLTATATFGQVNLSWSASVNATSYNIKRSPSSGGPYTTLGQSTSTTYTDNTVINGSTYYYVVSALNGSVESANSTQAVVTVPLPPVPTPQIGYVDFPSTASPQYTSVFHPVTSFTLNNDAYIVIVGATGSQTYYNYGNTITNGGPTNGIPDPTSASASAPSGYTDGLFPNQVVAYAVAQTLPDLTIRAIGEKPDGSPNSAIALARIQFITANPLIIGANAALFNITDFTTGAHLYYTIDGSDPSSTNANAVDLGISPNSTNTWTVSLSIQTNTLFKVRAFRDNYQASGIVSNLFNTATFQPTTITFGRPTGEPHSSFAARPGQYFYAPVTLQLVAGFDKMYSLQFNVTVTNGLVNTNTSLMPPPIVNGAGIDFFSMLMTAVPPDEGKYFPPANGSWYLPIPPLVPNISPGTTNIVTSAFLNTNINLLGIGWLYRSGIAYTAIDSNGVVDLDFDTTKQDLISFSIAHDTLFAKAGGTVVVGAYSFQVPSNTVSGDKYFIQLGSPSATSDGVGAPGSSIYIAAPPISQTVTVGSPAYVVGDAAPFHWLNAGDFGDTNLDNSDVMQVYQSAILVDANGQGVNMPPINSDLYLAMDSAGGLGAFDANNGYYTNSVAYTNAFGVGSLTNLWDGNDTTINQTAFGDGLLDINDVFVTFRRSLDPSLIWFKRYWTNGQFVAVTTTNYAFNTNTPHISMMSKMSYAQASVQPDYRQSSINFNAGDAVVVAGQTIQIPINAQIFGDYPLRVLGLNLNVVPLDGSPAITSQVTFTPVAGLGNPTISSSKGAANYSAAWLNSSISGLSGDVLIGTLTVKIPANATTSSAYAVHFNKASGSPNGLALFPKQAFTGLITLASRSNSSYGDSIPDSWRLRWFGTINNLLSISNACPSGDGVNNWKKFVAGVDPNTANNFPSVNAKSSVPAGYTSAIHWPSVNGKKYVIERSSSLFPGTWSILSTNTGTGSDMEYDDTNAGTIKFYRVRILP